MQTVKDKGMKTMPDSMTNTEEGKQKTKIKEKGYLRGRE